MLQYLPSFEPQYINLMAIVGSYKLTKISQVVVTQRIP